MRKITKIVVGLLAVIGLTVSANAEMMTYEVIQNGKQKAFMTNKQMEEKGNCLHVYYPATDTSTGISYFYKTKLCNPTNPAMEYRPNNLGANRTVVLKEAVTRIDFFSNETRSDMFVTSSTQESIKRRLEYNKELTYNISVDRYAAEKNAAHDLVEYAKKERIRKERNNRVINTVRANGRSQGIAETEAIYKPLVKAQEKAINQAQIDYADLEKDYDQQETILTKFRGDNNRLKIEKFNLEEENTKLKNNWGNKLQVFFKNLASYFVISYSESIEVPTDNGFWVIKLSAS